jgi:type I restriction enzyme S subunit
MSVIQTVGLGSLTAIKTGRLDANASVDDGAYPFFTCSKKPLKIDRYSFDGDYVLVAGNGDLNVKHYIGKFDAYQRTYAIKSDKEKLDSRFLFYFLSKYIDVLRNQSIGGVIKYIKIGNLTDAKIPLPPLAEQQKIAAILDAADSLRQKDQQLIDHYTTLSQSLFLEMFGDPVTNPMGWERTAFGSLITVLTDYHANGSYEVLKKNVELKSENDYALMVRTTDLEHNNYDDNVVYISQHAYEYLHKSKVYGGEIIISKIGSAGKVFLMPYLNRPVSLGMNAFLLRFDNNLNNLFVYYLLTSKFGEIEIGKRIKGAVTKTIRKDALREIDIIIPPIALQNQFAKRIQAIESQKQQAQASLEKSNDLFNSLLQRAFNGELTVSKAA